MLNELEEPLPGLGVEICTPKGTEQLVTDAGGSVRVDSAPEGFGSARLLDLTELRDTLRGFEMRTRRMTPYPLEADQPDWHVRSVRRAGDLVTLPDGQTQHLLIASRVDLRFESASTDWPKLELANETGPWMLTEQNQLHVQIHADGTGQRLVIHAERDEVFHPPAPPNLPPPPEDELARWEAPNIYVVQDGDWLAGIAERYLGDGARWNEIWALNKPFYPGRSPDVLYPDDRFVVPDEAVPLWLRIQAALEAMPAAHPIVAPPMVWLDVDVDELMDAFLEDADSALLDVLLSIPLAPPPWEPPLGPTLLEDLLYAYALDEASRARE